MIIAWYMDKKLIHEEISLNNQHLIQEALWLDLINPSSEEKHVVERIQQLQIPSREEMQEIEQSSRLYEENGILYMTATMVAQSQSIAPNQDAVTFVLTKKQLVTIRYIEPQTFQLFAATAPKLHIAQPAPFLIELLDTTIDRFADILEAINHQLEQFSARIFQPQNNNAHAYHELLQHLGMNGALNSKIVESLVSFNRLISFFEQHAADVLDRSDHARLLTLHKDTSSLSDHAHFISDKISFLLDATLGMVQIEQNTIIKIFSVAAVIFLPPTLIASIYGMNFHEMPELSWKYGYFLAIALMVFAAWAPYKYFKYRKWL